MYVVLLSAALQSDVSLKNALSVFEHKSALNKKKAEPRDLGFLNSMCVSSLSQLTDNYTYEKNRFSCVLIGE